MSNFTRREHPTLETELLLCFVVKLKIFSYLAIDFIIHIQLDIYRNRPAMQ